MFYFIVIKLTFTENVKMSFGIPLSANNDTIYPRALYRKFNEHKEIISVEIEKATNDVELRK